jgi:hypothetical protein
MGKKFDDYLKIRETVKLNKLSASRVKLEHIDIGLKTEKADQKALINILKIMIALNTVTI